MPESRSRKQGASAPSTAGTGDVKPNARWFVPVMLGLMLLGLAWIVVFYLSDTRFPVPDIGAWNLIIGFGFVMAGFLMTTRWR